VIPVGRAKVSDFGFLIQRTRATRDQRSTSQNGGRNALVPADSLGRDFLTVDGNVSRGFDSDSNLIAVDLHDGHNDVVTNDDLLAQLPAKNQHGFLPVDVEGLELDLPCRNSYPHILYCISCAV
jgi:hypothetical protein